MREGCNLHHVDDVLVYLAQHLEWYVRLF